MTKEDFAALITGREYGKELTLANEAEAKAAGLLVIFGASDDLLEVRGAFDDECGAYGGVAALIYEGGILPSWEELEKDDQETVELWCANKRNAKTVTADWDTDGYSWVISSALPHATFEIIEDGAKYCRGIVIAISDLQPLAA